MIYLRLEQISENFDAIQPNRKPIAIFFLWTTRIELLNESRRFGWQSDATRHRFLGLWDRFHPANPASAVTYLDALLGYLDVDHGRVTECPGSEQGARAASLCLLRALAGVDSGSMVFRDVRERYDAVIPPHADFDGLLCYHAINAIHATLVGRRTSWTFSWTDYNPCAQEYVFFANALVQVAQGGKLPHWVLHFVIYSLSKYPPSPTSVVIDCLTIVATDFGCAISEDDSRNPDDRYARLA